MILSSKSQMLLDFFTKNQTLYNIKYTEKTKKIVGNPLRKDLLKIYQFQGKPHKVRYRGFTPLIPFRTALPPPRRDHSPNYH